MKLLVYIFMVSILRTIETYQKLISPTPASSEMFPYHAVLETEGWWCNGVLISETFVLTRASCLIKDTKAKIYLGFSRNPYFPTNLQDLGGQNFYADEVYIHNEFGTVDITHQYINNLALVRLNKPVVLSATVHPINIAGPEDFPIPQGTYINLTGFSDYNRDGPLQYSTVQMRDLDSCVLLFGDSFLQNQERCVRQNGTQRNKWAGPYVVNGVLIGLQRSLHAEAKCFTSSPPCDVNDVFLSLEYYLEWIYRISNVAGAGVDTFEFDNPYWDYRPDRIQKQVMNAIQETVIDLHVTVKSCKKNENDFIKTLQDAIEKNLNQGLKSVMFTVDLV